MTDQLIYISETELGQRIRDIQEAVRQIREEATAIAAAVDVQRSRYRELREQESDLERQIFELIRCPGESGPLGLPPVFLP